MGSRLDAQFVTSASSIADAPQDQMPEVAFVGRSNSGKSSVLNCLTGRAKLARTSKTPGRTQMFNYFEVQDVGRLVDLPGYGYAKVSKRLSRAWQKNIYRYLSFRAELQGLVLVMDARHPLRESDLDMIVACQEAKLPVLALLNKSDKLSKSAKLQCLREAQSLVVSLGAVPIETMNFSAHTGEGADEARAWIFARFGA